MGPRPVYGQNSAPSSHLVFDDRFDGDILLHEVRVPRDGEALHTYYETLGWRGNAAGYAGIQAHPRGHNYIFSIWDHDSHQVPIRAVYRGAGTLTEKFGGEGTGLKSWNFELGWDVDTWYTLVARCWPVGENTFYGFWVRSGKTGEWTHLVTMDVATPRAWFRGGTDAFLEDWLATGQQPRETQLRGGFKRRLDGSWFAFTQARYSVNKWDLDPGKRSYNFRNNWNGGVSADATGDFYFMVAGGKDTQPEVPNPALLAIPRSDHKPSYPAGRLTSGNAQWTDAGQLTVTWNHDGNTVPPFRVSVALFDNPEARTPPLATAEQTAPHAREIDMSVPAGWRGNNLYVQLKCQDILGNTAGPLILAIDEKNN